MTSAQTIDTQSVLRQVTQSVSDRAGALDDGVTDVRADIAELGRAGLFELGYDSTGLQDMVRAIEEVSSHSLAVGFSAWAHRMTLEYLHHAPAPLRDRHFAELSSGSRIGVTAMAAALKQAAGLGAVPVVGEWRGNELTISGPIHWASNVFPEALMVLPARTPTGETVVVAVDVDAAGVTVNTHPRLMALGATASTSLRLKEVVVPSGNIITSDLSGFVQRIRPTFLLLQTAFCVGVGGAALAATGDLASKTGAQFEGERSHLLNTSAALRQRLYEFANDPSAATIADLLRLRLDAATAALAATRLEFSVTGGTAYAVGSPANRRFREAAFLPIQSPSEGQLRWELTQYE
jgi:alkylation response protein AidB-like acyl-CoA dehydrogenase